MNRREFAIQTSLGALGTLFFSCTDGEKFPFKKDQTIGCFGDSITYGSGNGYVELLQAVADKKRPDLNLKFINYGKSSETVTGLTEVEHPGPRPYLFERLDSELKKEPLTIALFCYGINCGIYGEPSQALFDSFKTGVYSFLEKMRQGGIGSILLTPPPLAMDVQSKAGAKTNTEHYGYLNPYPKYDKEVLQVFKDIILGMDHPSVLTTVDIHSPLSLGQANCYDTDPIHPNATGHRLITDTIVEKLRF